MALTIQNATINAGNSLVGLPGVDGIIDAFKADVMFLNCQELQYKEAREQIAERLAIFEAINLANDLGLDGVKAELEIYRSDKTKNTVLASLSVRAKALIELMKLPYELTPSSPKASQKIGEVITKCSLQDKRNIIEEAFTNRKRVALISEQMVTHTKGMEQIRFNKGIAQMVIYDPSKVDYIERRGSPLDSPSSVRRRFDVSNRASSLLSGDKASYNKGGLVSDFRIKEKETNELIRVRVSSAHLASSGKGLSERSLGGGFGKSSEGRAERLIDLINVMLPSKGLLEFGDTLFGGTRETTYKLKWQRLKSRAYDGYFLGMDANTRNDELVLDGQKIKSSSNPWSNPYKNAQTYGMMMLMPRGQSYSGDNTYCNDGNDKAKANLVTFDPKRHGVISGSVDHVLNAVASAKDDSCVHIHTADNEQGITIINADSIEDNGQGRDHQIVISPKVVVTASDDEFNRVRNMIAMQLGNSAPKLADEIFKLEENEDNKKLLVQVYDNYLSSEGLLKNRALLHVKKLACMDRIRAKVFDLNRSEVNKAGKVVKVRQYTLSEDEKLDCLKKIEGVLCGGDKPWFEGELDSLDANKLKGKTRRDRCMLEIDKMKTDLLLALVEGININTLSYGNFANTYQAFIDAVSAFYTESSELINSEDISQARFDALKQLWGQLADYGKDTFKLMQFNSDRDYSVAKELETAANICVQSVKDIATLSKRESLATAVSLNNSVLDLNRVVFSQARRQPTVGNNLQQDIENAQKMANDLKKLNNTSVNSDDLGRQPQSLRDKVATMTSFKKLDNNFSTKFVRTIIRFLSKIVPDKFVQSAIEDDIKDDIISGLPKNSQ